MKKKIIIAILFIVLVSFARQIKSEGLQVEHSLKTQSQILLKSKLKCFTDNLLYSNNKPAYSEVSGVIFVNNKLYFVNDKSIPGKSPIFKIGFDIETMNLSDEIEYLEFAEIVNSEKFEDIAVTPDLKYIIAITAFDRALADTNKFDNYNKIVSWQSANQQDSDTGITIIFQTDNSGVVSSVSMREQIKKTLISEEFPKGPEYFKIEGLTVIPDSKILIGIREYGRKYDDFKYSVKILSSDYYINDGKIVIRDNWRQIYEFNTSVLEELNYRQLGVSGLTYDFANDLLYILTSYEENEKFDGYLWKITLSDFTEKKMPLPVYDMSGKKFLSFAPHKPEGITLLDANRILIVFDDDRITEYEMNDNSKIFRNKNEAWYSIIKLETEK